MKSILFLVSFILIAPNIYSQKAKKVNADDNFFYKGRPSIELSYGQSVESVKDFSIPFDKYGIIELKLGYYYEGETKYSKKITRYKNKFLSAAYSDTKLKFNNSNDGYKFWRFNIGNSEGYGYKSNKRPPLNLFNSYTMNWTSYNKYKLYFEPWETPDEVVYLTKFNDRLRFGNSTESGISFSVIDYLYVSLNFERAIIYPRHLFWKWLGSEVIELTAQEAVDQFVKAIMKTSPGAGPIMSFLLKNGLAYGLYELRREKMNWPFNSDKPLLFDSFKIGVNVVF